MCVGVCASDVCPHMGVLVEENLFERKVYFIAGRMRHLFEPGTKGRKDVLFLVQRKDAKRIFCGPKRKKIQLQLENYQGKH